MSKWTKEQLTCPECAAQGTEFVAKDMRGLNGHRMFKHGVHPSAPQLPLMKQDLLISESRLEQLLDARFAVISEQVDALSGKLEQQGEQQGNRSEQLEQRLAAAECKTIDDFTPREKAEWLIPWMHGLSGEDFVRLALETGHEARLVPAVDPEAVAAIAETFKRQAKEAKAKAEDEPTTIQGKTTKPGYKYLEHLNLSVQE